MSTTPKIFVLKEKFYNPIESKDNWDYQYLCDYDPIAKTYNLCDFENGATRFSLEEASLLASELNKSFINYFEITHNKIYTQTKEEWKASHTENPSI